MNALKSLTESQGISSVRFLDHLSSKAHNTVSLNTTHRDYHSCQKFQTGFTLRISPGESDDASLLSTEMGPPYLSDGTILAKSSSPSGKRTVIFRSLPSGEKIVFCQLYESNQLKTSFSLFGSSKKTSIYADGK